MQHSVIVIDRGLTTALQLTQGNVGWRFSEVLLQPFSSTINLTCEHLKFAQFSRFLGVLTNLFNLFSYFIGMYETCRWCVAKGGNEISECCDIKVAVLELPRPTGHHCLLHQSTEYHALILQCNNTSVCFSSD